MYRTIGFAAVALVAALAGLAAVPALGGEPAELRLLAVSVGESRAVVADGSGELRVVGAGEALPGGVTVVEVLTDRLVVELPAAETGEDEGARLRAWLFRARRAGEASRLVVLDRRPPAGLDPVGLSIAEPFDLEAVPPGALAGRAPRPPPAEAAPAPAGDGGLAPPPEPDSADGAPASVAQSSSSADGGRGAPAGGPGSAAASQRPAAPTGEPR